MLQETYVVMTRELPQPLRLEAARMVVEDFAAWHVQEPSAGDVLAAIDLSVGSQVSFWDTMILVAAQRLGQLPSGRRT